MLHWYTVVSMLAIAVLLANYVLLQQRLYTCVHETTPERLSRNLSALDIVKEEGSSVLCWGDHHTTRLCHFTNLCYLSWHDTFAFFHHSNDSVISGVPM